MTVSCRKKGVADRVTLNLQALQQIYTALERKPKADLHDALRNLLMKYQADNDTLSEFCKVQLERIAQNRKAEYLDGDLQEYANLLMAVSEIFGVRDETYIRDFSVRIFGDSKTFEKIRNKVVSLLFQYGDFPEKDTILEDLNIVRNPSHVYLKGSGIITIAGQKIDLSVLNGDIALSSDLLKQIELIQVTGNRVVTIETRHTRAHETMRCSPYLHNRNCRSFRLAAAVMSARQRLYFQE